MAQIKAKCYNFYEKLSGRAGPGYRLTFFAWPDPDLDSQKKGSGPGYGPVFLITGRDRALIF